jgi:hypothetical protein
VIGLTFFFSNFGPNTTTYVVPGEIFPTAIRATCHGLSAAAGKLGAIVVRPNFSPITLWIGQRLNCFFSLIFPFFFYFFLFFFFFFFCCFQGVAGFVPFVELYGVNIAFFACSLIAVLGLVMSITLVPETKDIDFSKMDLEDEQEVAQQVAAEEQQVASAGVEPTQQLDEDALETKPLVKR